MAHIMYPDGWCYSRVSNQRHKLNNAFREASQRRHQKLAFRFGVFPLLRVGILVFRWSVFASMLIQIECRVGLLGWWSFHPKKALLLRESLERTKQRISVRDVGNISRHQSVKLMTRTLSYNDFISEVVLPRNQKLTGSHDWIRDPSVIHVVSKALFSTDLKKDLKLLADDLK